MAQLLVAAHEFQDKTTSELYLTKTVLKKCTSKDEVIIDMRQAIKVCFNVDFLIKQIDEKKCKNIVL